MTRARQQLEKKVQREVELALGAEPDLLLIKNSVGQAEYTDDDGKSFFVPYGLGKGSPDLVGLLRVQLSGYDDPFVRDASGKPVGHVMGPSSKWTHTVGLWFCLEVKADGGVLSPDQEKTHAIWRRFGAFIDTVRSVKEARAALERARRLEF